MRHLFRFLFAALAALLVLPVFGLQPASAQDGPPNPAPFPEPPTAEESAYYDGLVTCPPVGALAVEQQTARQAGAGSIQIRCIYDGSPFIELTWDTPTNPNPRNCRIPELFERDDRIVVFAGVPGRAIRASADYDPALYDGLRSDWQAAVQSLASLVVDLASSSCPPEIECTSPLGGLTNTFDNPLADVSASENQWTVDCWWQSPSGEESEVLLDLWYATDLQDGPKVITICGIEDSFDAAIGFVDGPGNLAVGARYDFRDAGKPFDRDLIETEIRRIFDIVAPLARTCDGVPFIPKSSYYTPAPLWLSDALTPGTAVGAGPVEVVFDGTGVDDEVGPAVEGAPESAAPAETTTGDDVASADTVVDEPPEPATQDSSTSSLTTVWRIAGVVLIVFSVLMLGLALYMSRKETRIRPRWEVARLAIAAAVSAASVVLIGTATPPWAIAVAVVAGIGLGLWQGRNLVVRMSQRGLVSTRSTVAVIAFGLGLIITQAAGLVNRTGAITLGIALTVLSAATTVGLIVGRRPQLVQARSAAAALVLMVLVGSIAAGLVAPAPSDAQQATDLTELIAWDEVLLVGGVANTQSKPPIAVPFPRDFATAPDPLTVDLAWEHVDAARSIAYDLTETYTFNLADGVCCGADYEASGVVATTDDSGTTTQTIDATAALSSVALLAPDQPFGQSTALASQCGRPITEPRGGGEWTTYLLDGEPQNLRASGPDMTAYVDCDIDGFSIEDALADAPAPPPSDQARCPVYQEAFGGLYDPIWQGPSDAATVTQLLTQPNSPGCGGGITLGSDAQGGRRNEFFYDMASPDPAAQARQLWDAYDDILLEFPLHEIPDERRCDVDAEGVPVQREGQEFCNHRSYHKVDDGEITIWTDTDVRDGPNTFIRGRFPWGQYRFRCHHCLVGDPEIARTLAEWHEFGANWYGPESAVGSTGAPTPVPTAVDPETAALAQDAEELGVDSDLIDLVTDEDADNDARNAALAGLIGVLGAGGMLGAAIAESGASAAEIADAFRSGGRGGLDALLEDRGNLQQPQPDESGVVVDELGNQLRPGEDGLYEWDTGDRSERLSRPEIEERIAAEQQAINERDARHQSIVDDMESEEAAADRFDDLFERSVAENDALMEEIREGWERVDELQEQLDRREVLLNDLEQALAEQRYGDRMSEWDQQVYDALRGMGNDVAGLPGEVLDAGMWVFGQATEWENWVAAGETIYDATGLIAGGLWGDGAQSIVDAAEFGGRVYVAVGQGLVKDPVGTIVMFTPLQDFADAVDGNRSLGQRLGSLGMGVLDVAGTLAGLGAATGLGDMGAAARAGERALDAADTTRDTARGLAAAELADAGDAAVDAQRGLGRARVPDSDLTPAMLETRDAMADVVQRAQDQARATGRPVADVLGEMPEARTLFQDGVGMNRMGALEAAGGLSDEMAQAVVGAHDAITGRAGRQGTLWSLDDMGRRHGFRPQEVLVGNSGSTGAARSVVTDADRTLVTVFSDADLDTFRSRHPGMSRAEAAENLQNEFRDLHRRNTELGLNDLDDPAVQLARRDDISLDEAVTRLGNDGIDDPTAAAQRLSRGQMDTESYSGFGSLTGPNDSYPAGYTRARQSIQGETTVYRPRPDGTVNSHRASPDAIIDQHELERARHAGDVSRVDSDVSRIDGGRGLPVDDPRYIPDRELAPLLSQQVSAVAKYDDVKSVAKAVDRAEYVAGRLNRPLGNSRLVTASTAIRNNPRDTAVILRELGMTEAQFVSETKLMMAAYGQ